MSWILVGLILYGFLTTLILYSLVHKRVVNYRADYNNGTIRYFRSGHFTLLNWRWGARPQTDGRSLADGCAQLILSPFFVFRKCLAVLRFSWINFRYYWIGGEARRIHYINEYVEKEIEKISNYERKCLSMLEMPEIEMPQYEGFKEDVGDDLKTMWIRDGKNEVWDLREVEGRKSYEKFLLESLMPPAVFWKSFALSIIGFILWPFIIFVIGWFTLVLVVLFTKPVMDRIVGDHIPQNNY